jgi:hypothetical protein
VVLRSGSARAPASRHARAESATVYADDCRKRPVAVLWPGKINLEVLVIRVRKFNPAFKSDVVWNGCRFSRVKNCGSCDPCDEEEETAGDVHVFVGIYFSHG